MLSKADDYPIHQSPEPVAFAGQSRNFYDRYFFNGYDQEEDFFFALAMGIYPQLDVIDAGFSIIRNGVQHNILCSRPLGMERMDTQVGPITLKVIEPLQCLQIDIHAPEDGIEAQLIFHGRAPAQEEPRFTRRHGAQVFMDYTRMTQNGCWEGWVKHQGTHRVIEPQRILGTRDRSWGIRPVGAADTQENPAAPPLSQFYWLWAPINWADGISLYHLNADADGVPWNTDGRYLATAAGQEGESMLSVASRLKFIPGTRHAAAAELFFRRREGGEVHIQLKPRFHFYMKGIGYGHERFAHGTYQGGEANLYEEYVLAEVDDALTLHIQAVCQATMTGDLGEKVGHGVLEQLIVGPHAPSGFRELLDMAPE